MMFVYLMAILITSFWALRMIGEKRWLWEKSPLDLPLLIFLIANVLSTIFSIDPHTSIFGYYSRLNGGLLSLICYLLLFWAFMANFPREKIRHFLGAIVLGGFLVSLWAIPEHFGIDPSCRILVETWSADCWVQDVQARVFATLGQPNWLAAYLGMIIPVSLGLTLLEKKTWLKLFYLLASTSMTLAFIFTYSRGGMLGLVVGMGLFGALLLVGKRKISWPHLNSSWKYLVGFGLIGVVFALVFGTAFNKPLNLFPPKPSSESSTPSTPSNPSAGGTQLEAGGTESGKIRLIVWQGALDIWKAYPLVGSGVETFAQSYYQFRPQEHNSITEWDFLYNKAHNEYLNYLATTGAFGFLSYLLVIATFLFYTFLKLWQSAPYYRVVIGGLLAGYLVYLVQNFFGFSVVMIALLFYLYPAIVFKLLPAQEEISLLAKFRNRFITFFKIPSALTNFKVETQTSLLFTGVLLITSVLLFGLFRVYSADLKFTDGFKSEGGSSWETSKYLIEQALILNPLEPFYMSELGYVNAVMATQALTDEEGQKLAEEAQKWAIKATKVSPYSLSYQRSLVRVYTELMDQYPGLEDKTVQAAKKTVELAPTEPAVRYNLAALYTKLGRFPEAITEFKKVTELKPDYREAYLGLARSYEANKDRDQAIEVYKEMRKRFPQETEAKIKLKEWTGSED